jgi:hypothetical protein
MGCRARPPSRGFAVVAAHDHGGLQEVGDGGTFAQELRVGDDLHVGPGDDLLDDAGGAHGHRGLVDDDGTRAQ